MVRLAKKFASNSSTTAFCNNCCKLWGCTLEIGINVPHGESPSDDLGVWELTDLSVNFSPNILKIMHRNGGVNFLIKHTNPMNQINDICMRVRNIISFGVMG